MVTDNYLQRYTGRWYSSLEAQKVETDLQKNAYTGETWNWIDKNGTVWELSGHQEVPMKVLNRFERRRKLFGSLVHH